MSILSKLPGGLTRIQGMYMYEVSMSNRDTTWSKCISAELSVKKRALNSVINHGRCPEQMMKLSKCIKFKSIGKLLALSLIFVTNQYF